MLVVFAVATFVGAWLVFLVQPMVAKMVLPLFGGTPAVWNTAMVFFQATLLLGYGYAHLATRWLHRTRDSPRCPDRACWRSVGASPKSTN